MYNSKALNASNPPTGRPGRQPIQPSVIELLLCWKQNECSDQIRLQKMKMGGDDKCDAMASVRTTVSDRSNYCKHVQIILL